MRRTRRCRSAASAEIERWHARLNELPPGVSRFRTRNRGGMRQARSKGEERHAEDHPLSVVRQQGRGGRQLLRLDLQELQDRQRHPLRQGRPGPKGSGRWPSSSRSTARSSSPSTAARSSSSARPSRSTSTARRRRRSTTVGASSPTGGEKSSAAGSRTSSACPGRSFRPLLGEMLRTGTRKGEARHAGACSR